MTFTANWHDLSFVYTALIRLFSVYLLITSLEYARIIREFSGNGLFSWKILRTGIPPRILPLCPGFLFGPAGVFGMMLARIACSIALFIAPLTPYTVFWVAVIAIIALLLALRNSIGNDGSDQMAMIVSISLLLSFAAHDPKIASLGLYFMAAQAILAYGIAGLAKLLSRKWRSGLAVFQVMNMETFGNERLARWLHGSRPWVSRLLAWHILLFETFFFLVLFLPQPWCYILLAWGLLFHLFNAVVMGLNRFFWVFLATYPAILYVNAMLHPSTHVI